MKNERYYTGQRDQRIEVVEFTADKNLINEDAANKTEVSIGFFYAHLKDLSGAEDEEGKIINIIGRMYVIPFHPDVKTRGEQMYVKHEGKVFKIYHVEELGRREQLLLKCTTRE